jgi:hypothetical protein
MTMDSYVLLGVLAGMIAFVVYLPILKPWFGFRKPKGHTGRWFQ